jgi:hypothetical protein
MTNDRSAPDFGHSVLIRPSNSVFRDSAPNR